MVAQLSTCSPLVSSTIRMGDTFASDMLPFQKWNRGGDRISVPPPVPWGVG